MQGALTGPNFLSGINLMEQFEKQRQVRKQNKYNGLNAGGTALVP